MNSDTLATPAREAAGIEVRVRDLKARCRCGASAFLPPHEPPFASESVFTCASCGRKYCYGELLDEIGQEAMRQARESLGKLKRLRARRGD